MGCRRMKAAVFWSTVAGDDSGFLPNSWNGVNVSKRGSDLRVQIRTDPRYRAFVERSSRLDVLGLSLSARTSETSSRRLASKRQKDLTDISRIVEKYPELRALVPEAILERLV